MARLRMFVEGRTEQAFAARLLMPHLAACGVYLHPPVQVAKGRRRGRTLRGGGRRYGAMKRDIQRHLQDRSADAYATTMIDLYALPDSFPGRTECQAGAEGPYQRVAALENAFARDIGDRRFIPYLQLHEFEALLLADPLAFGAFFDQDDPAIARLSELVKGHASPEEIDDGAETAPSKRIAALLPDYALAKATVGPIIAEAVGLQRMRAVCPHFDAWLRRLERLGE